MREFLKYAQPDYLDFVSELESEEFTMADIAALIAAARSVRNQVLGSTGSWSFIKDKDVPQNLRYASGLDTIRIIHAIKGLTGYVQPVHNHVVTPMWEGSGKYARLQIINDLLWALQRYEYEGLLEKWQ